MKIIPPNHTGCPKIHDPRQTSPNSHLIQVIQYSTPPLSCITVVGYVMLCYNLSLSSIDIIISRQGAPNLIELITMYMVLFTNKHVYQITHSKSNTNSDNTHLQGRGTCAGNTGGIVPTPSRGQWCENLLMFYLKMKNDEHLEQESGLQDGLYGNTMQQKYFFLCSLNDYIYRVKGKSRSIKSP